MADEGLLDRFGALALREADATTAEIDYGWCGGRHVLDDQFAFGHNVYDDCLRVGLRVDTNKVPSEIKKAYLALEEQASTREDGVVGKQQKKLARHSASERIDAEMRSGKFRRSKMTEVLWDLKCRWILSAVSGTSREQLKELLDRTTSLQLEPISAGTLVRRICESSGKLRDYEDLKPTRFFLSEQADESMDYPWAPRADKSRDFTGNELLLWLWYESMQGGEIDLGKQAVQITVQKMLDLECIYGQSGKASLKHEQPTSMSEALEAVRSGKIPRKLGLVLAIDNQLFPFTLQAETLAVGGLKLPEVDDADSPRVLFEMRIALLREFIETLDRVIEKFVEVRVSGAWPGIVKKIRDWAGRSRSPVVYASTHADAN